MWFMRVTFAFIVPFATVGLAQAGEEPRALARSVLKQLIEIDTTDSNGDNTAAAEAVARRLREAGFPQLHIEVVVPAPKKGNLVARIRGPGAGRPVLVLLRRRAHRGPSGGRNHRFRWYYFCGMAVARAAGGGSGGWRWHGRLAVG